MSVFVDGAKNALGRMKMSHMMADSEVELHEMARAIGLRLEWFQAGRFPHYDICQAKRTEAVRRGAVEVETKDLIKMFGKRRKR